MRQRNFDKGRAERTRSARPLSEQIVLISFGQFLRLAVSLRSTVNGKIMPHFVRALFQNTVISPTRIIPVIQNLLQFYHILAWCSLLLVTMTMTMTEWILLFCPVRPQLIPV